MLFIAMVVLTREALTHHRTYHRTISLLFSVSFKPSSIGFNVELHFLTLCNSLSDPKKIDT